MGATDLNYSEGAFKYADLFSFSSINVSTPHSVTAVPNPSAQQVSLVAQSNLVKTITSTSSTGGTPVQIAGHLGSENSVWAITSYSNEIDHGNKDSDVAAFNASELVDDLEEYFADEEDGDLQDYDKPMFATEEAESTLVPDCWITFSNNAAAPSAPGISASILTDVSVVTPPPSLPATSIAVYSTSIAFFADTAADGTGDVASNSTDYRSDATVPDTESDFSDYDSINTSSPDPKNIDVDVSGEHQGSTVELDGSAFENYTPRDLISEKEYDPWHFIVRRDIKDRYLELARFEQWSSKNDYISSGSVDYTLYPTTASFTHASSLDADSTTTRPTYPSFSLSAPAPTTVAELVNRLVRDHLPQFWQYRARKPELNLYKNKGSNNTRPHSDATLTTCVECGFQFHKVLLYDSPATERRAHRAFKKEEAKAKADKDPPSVGKGGQIRGTPRKRKSLRACQLSLDRSNRNLQDNSHFSRIDIDNTLNNNRRARNYDGNLDYLGVKEEGHATKPEGVSTPAEFRFACSRSSLYYPTRSLMASFVHILPHNVEFTQNQIRKLFTYFIWHRWFDCDMQAMTIRRAYKELWPLFLLRDEDPDLTDDEKDAFKRRQADARRKRKLSRMRDGCANNRYFDKDRGPLGRKRQKAYKSPGVNPVTIKVEDGGSGSVASFSDPSPRRCTLTPQDRERIRLVSMEQRFTTVFNTGLKNHQVEISTREPNDYEKARTARHIAWGWTHHGPAVSRNPNTSIEDTAGHEIGIKQKHRIAFYKIRSTNGVCYNELCYGLRMRNRQLTRPDDPSALRLLTRKIKRQFRRAETHRRLHRFVFPEYKAQEEKRRGAGSRFKTSGSSSSSISGNIIIGDRSNICSKLSSVDSDIYQRAPAGSTTSASAATLRTMPKAGTSVFSSNQKKVTRIDRHYTQSYLPTTNISYQGPAIRATTTSSARLYSGGNQQGQRQLPFLVHPLPPQPRRRQPPWLQHLQQQWQQQLPSHNDLVQDLTQMSLTNSELELFMTQSPPASISLNSGQLQGYQSSGQGSQEYSLHPSHPLQHQRPRHLMSFATALAGPAISVDIGTKPIGVDSAISSPEPSLIRIAVPVPVSVTVPAMGLTLSESDSFFDFDAAASVEVDYHVDQGIGLHTDFIGGNDGAASSTSTGLGDLDMTHGEDGDPDIFDDEKDLSQE
ncbi:hypothetical protein BGZ98_001672 [Dissophora globulifera]|nr:hypothetical protein BGZ98_001672 [Dissophora globulifera]